MSYNAPVTPNVTLNFVIKPYNPPVTPNVTLNFGAVAGGGSGGGNGFTSSNFFMVM
jgi:hypothetical protein